MTTEHQTCQLCGDRHGRVRNGRLGRYHVTCDDCEARRGSHLVRTGNGYVSRTTVPAELALAG